MHYLTTGNRFPGSLFTVSNIAMCCRSSWRLQLFPYASGDVTYITKSVSPAFAVLAVLAWSSHPPPGDVTQRLICDGAVANGTFSEKLQNHSSRPSMSFSGYHTEFGNNVVLNFTTIKGQQSNSIFQFVGWL